MNDYSELIAALRHCSTKAQCDGCPREEWCTKNPNAINVGAEAADAIEELVAEFNQLRAQMPKIGKWIPDADDLAWDDPYTRVRMRCSVCNATAHSDDWARKFVLSEYCPHCGAKMEVGEE